MKRLHITGCRRSGTTLLFEMLSTCFSHDWHCEHEQSIFVPVAENPDQLGFSKKPSDITHIHSIFEADPNLYLMFVRRDPRAVITSIHPTKSDVYYASFERWQRYEQAAASLLNHPRFLLIRYEQLVQDPDKVQAEIQQRFPFLEQQYAFSEFHQYAKTSKKAQISLKGLRPINKDSLNAWQQHLPRIKFQLEKYPELSQTIMEHGYETSNDWLEPLNEVKQKAQRYGEVKPSSLKRLETNLRYKLKSHAYLKHRS